MRERSISVLLVDDDRLMRDGLARLFRGDAKFGLVGAVGTVEAGLELARELEPEIALVDVVMPDGGCAEFVARGRHAGVKSRVVAYSAWTSPLTVASMVAAGAQGYARKEEGYQSLSRTLQVVADARGEIVSDLRELTSRQREVLLLLAKGLEDDEIGRKLSVSKDTVRGHVKKLRSILGANSRVQLCLIAIQAGLPVLD